MYVCILPFYLLLSCEMYPSVDKYLTNIKFKTCKEVNTKREVNRTIWKTEEN